MTVRLVGLATMLKSGDTWEDIVRVLEIIAVCFGLPASVTVRVILYVPAEV